MSTESESVEVEGCRCCGREVPPHTTKRFLFCSVRCRNRFRRRGRATGRRARSHAAAASRRDWVRRVLVRVIAAGMCMTDLARVCGVSRERIRQLASERSS